MKFIRNVTLILILVVSTIILTESQSPVPEPATIILFGIGLLCVAGAN